MLRFDIDTHSISNPSQDAIANLHSELDSYLLMLLNASSQYPVPAIPTIVGTLNPLE